MDEKARKRRDFRQNICIVLLSLTAVLLLSQTQIFRLGLDFCRGYFMPLISSSTVDESSSQSAAPAAPLHVAVTGLYGRYGSITATTADSSFDAVRGLLQQALGSAAVYTPCSRSEFLTAMSQVSTYCDFLQPLPLPVLHGLIGASDTDSALSARQLLLAAEEESCRLYLSDGTSYLRASTAVTAEALAGLAQHYELGNAAFSLDRSEQDPLYRSLAPYSLFPDTLPTLPVLTAQTPAREEDSLLAALGFNPHTRTRYTESNGTDVIMEGGSTLRLYPNGDIDFQSGDVQDSQNDAEFPSLWEAVVKTNQLLASLLPDSSARLYLSSIRRESSQTILQLDYQYSGVPIRRADGGCAAEVVLTHHAVTSVFLSSRQYLAEESVTDLLPLRQAIGIAAQSAGKELTLGYVDNGGSKVSVCWLAS